MGANRTHPGGRGWLGLAFAIVLSIASATAAQADVVFTDIVTVYDHSEFDGVIPVDREANAPYISPADSAFYSIRGIAIDPATQAIYSSWLHGNGSRWIFRHEFDGGGMIGDPTRAARLQGPSIGQYSESQPKSLAIDASGNVYAPILQGRTSPVPLGATQPAHINDVFKYSPSLKGDAADDFNTFDDPDAVYDIDALTGLPDIRPEGIAIHDGKMILTDRSSGGRVVRIDLATGQLDPTFGANGVATVAGAGSLRAVTVSQQTGDIFIADKSADTRSIFRLNDRGDIITAIEFEQGVRPHHLTITDVDGEEILIVTMEGELAIRANPVQTFADVSRFTRTILDGDFGSGAFFSQIAALGDTVYWAFEDVQSTNHIDTPNIDRILATQLSTPNGITPLTIPEPGSLLLLAALTTALLPRHRRPGSRSTS